jgi:predicted nucleic acid-binding protein
MTLYLDTSSLVKLYVEEEGSAAVRACVRAADVVATAVIAYPEARAAFARLRRERVLRPTAFRAVKQALDDDWPRYLTFDITAGLARAAGDLAERFGLRGYDSVHLAAFTEIAHRAGATASQFSSYDDRLNLAARVIRQELR